MTYKQTMYFVGTCMSLINYPERREEVSKLIESGYVDWDNVVKFSSNQMVVPALYYNLKHAKLLNILPQGLEYYFEEISNANRKRNKALIKQVDHLGSILNKHKIEFVLLKGMAHVLEGLYLNIGERMISDIDFLVRKSQVEIVAKILKEEGYKSLYEEKSTHTPRHYSRLIHKDFIGALEIHWDVLNNKNAAKLSSEMIFSNMQKSTYYYVPSYAHQAIYNMLNAQVNDSSYKSGLILLRQLYDCFLLSNKKEVQIALKNYKHNYYLKNLYLKCMHKLFKTEVLLYKKSFFLNLLMLRYEFTSNNNLYKIEYLSYRFYNYPRQIFLALINKEKRISIIKNLTTKGWIKRHLQSYKIGND